MSFSSSEVFAVINVKPSFLRILSSHWQKLHFPIFQHVVVTPLPVQEREQGLAITELPLLISAVLLSQW